ncbi:thioredoxin peroxidase [Heterostelium album PN500]|uniref:Thioredoxin peroxidase n=1 Tax=Heterostelium pallidum (strain ATCC 26659 / Pp 5 / PN500) TaxID=670386 RepID=D3BFU8_HETP5|nr:thioredoxin peroxidase [Heterostelium album PN500]EFA79708.1 thioredoxin peroxidase [Heterostelium album PN500]|eukprot:XP_020431829.1 thioredoxin peroxidase [Heterostelium album PN500]
MEPQTSSSCHLVLGDVCPNFNGESTMGKFGLKQYMGDSNYCLIFSQPKAKTPVGTSELGRICTMQQELEKRGCKVVVLTTDNLNLCEEWTKDINEIHGCRVVFPIVSDSDRKICKSFGMISVSNPNDVQSVRNVYVVGSDHKIKAFFAYPLCCGVNFVEIVRVLDSLTINTKTNVCTPADWRVGEDVFIDEKVSDDHAKKNFQNWKSVKPYIRVVPQPKCN